MTAIATQRGVATQLTGLAVGLLGQLPVRIRAWDGSEAGPADAPVLVLRDRGALRRLLWRPNELGLAQAYVTGEIDVAVFAIPAPLVAGALKECGEKKIPGAVMIDAYGPPQASEVATPKGESPNIPQGSPFLILLILTPPF